MVIFPETRSGRMKLRWVNWLTNWITSARSRLANDITTVRALVWMSLLSTAGVLGGSVFCTVGAGRGATGGCGAMELWYGIPGAGGGGLACCAAGGRTPGLRRTPRLGGSFF